MNIEPLLRQSEFFKDISESARRSVAVLCRQKTCKNRECLFVEGERGDAVYLLASGGIQLVKTTADGKEVVVRTVYPGETFAEAVLFEKNSYPVTAISIKKSVVYRIGKFDFHQLLRNEQFRNDFIGMLTRRLRYLADRILYLTAYDVDERLFRFLSDHYGRKEQYELPIPKRDIAAAIGTTPETLSRLFLSLKNDGKAVWHGKALRLKRGFWDNWE